MAADDLRDLRPRGISSYGTVHRPKDYQILTEVIDECVGFRLLYKLLREFPIVDIQQKEVVPKI